MSAACPAPTKPKPTAATLVLLVRHGQTPTTGNDPARPGARACTWPTRAGQQQAEAAAARIADARQSVAAVYASPLERTRETAAPIAKALGLRVAVDRGLLECDFGEWTGAELKDLIKLPEWRTVQRYPSGFRFPGGESFAEMQARIGRDHGRASCRPPSGRDRSSPCRTPTRSRRRVADALGTHLDLFQRIVVSPCSVTADLLRHRRPGGPRRQLDRRRLTTLGLS